MVEHNTLFQRLRLISNKHRFRIIEITEKTPLNITELSSRIGLAYTKCADYVSLMEKAGLIEKTRIGKEVKVESKVKLNEDSIKFI